MIKKKVLLVSYYFSPSPTPRAIRWKNLVEDFQANGHEVTVLTSSTASKDYSEDVNNLIRVDENIIGKLRNNFLSRKNKTSIDQFQRKINFSFTTLLFRIIKYLYKSIVSIFQWPDFSWTWVSAAKKKIIEIIKEEGEFDVVISVSHPFSSHLIARSIKKKYPNTRWILDNGDPFSLLEESKPNNFFLYRNLNKKIERHCINLSSYFCVTTNETKELYEELSPENSHKIKVIGPLLSKEAIDVFEGNHKREEKVELVFSFIGTIYKNLRNPDYIIKIIDSAFEQEDGKVILNFYGETNDVDILNYETKNINLQFHGPVTRKEALIAMHHSDFLINIGNTTFYQLPSKVAEYLASQKPIINFSSIDNDSSKKLLVGFQDTLNINSVTDIYSENEQKLLSFCNDLKQKNNSLVFRDIKRFTLKSVSLEYQKLFNQ